MVGPNKDIAVILMQVMKRKRRNYRDFNFFLFNIVNSISSKSFNVLIIGIKINYNCQHSEEIDRCKVKFSTLKLSQIS